MHPQTHWAEMASLLLYKIAAGIGTLAVASGFFLTVDLTKTISLGSILVGALVVVLAGVFTLRNNMRSFWKDLAEQRDAEVTELQKDLKAKEEEMAAFALAQQELRHELKAELDAAKLLLEGERAKTDLSALLSHMNEQHREVVAYLKDTQTNGIALITVALQGMSDRIEAGLTYSRAGQNDQEKLLKQMLEALTDLLARTPKPAAAASKLTP